MDAFEQTVFQSGAAPGIVTDEAVCGAGKQGALRCTFRRAGICDFIAVVIAALSADFQNCRSDGIFQRYIDEFHIPAAFHGNLVTLDSAPDGQVSGRYGFRFDLIFFHMEPQDLRCMCFHGSDMCHSGILFQLPRYRIVKIKDGSFVTIRNFRRVMIVHLHVDGIAVG